MEQVGMRPKVGGVVRDVDREVAHDADAAVVAVLLERVPLAAEEELPVLVGGDGVSEFLAPALHRVGLTRSEVAVPVGPDDQVMGVFGGHEEGEVFEPRSLRIAKCFVSEAVRRIGGGEEVGGGTAEKRELVWNDVAE